MKKKPQHSHSVADYQKAVDIIRASGLSKSKKRKAVRKVVNRLVEMI